MRVLTLELEGFGPYLAQQSVDFEAFEADGLFVITGRTGAGKSTILDAICFALYGSVPRYEGGEKTLRSHFCSEHDPTWVRLVFEVGGERYRIWRSPDYERAKKRGEGTTTKQAEAELHVWRSGDWEPLEVKPREVGHRIGEIMQLSADQFLQVILLAQGRFSEFLQAGTRERLDVLRSLFGTQRFGALEGHVRELAKEAGRGVEASDAALSGLIARVADLAGQEMPDAVGRDAWLDEVVAELARASAAADVARAEAAKAGEDSAKMLMDAEAAAERAAKIASARSTVATLESRAQAHTDDVERLALARRAVPVSAPLAAVERATTQRRSAQTSLEATLAQGQSSPAAGVAARGGELADADAPSLRGRSAELSAERGALEGALALEQSLPRLESEFEEAASVLEKARSTRAATEESLASLPEQVTALQGRRGEAAALAVRADDLAQAVERARRSVEAHSRAAGLTAALTAAQQTELAASEARRAAVEAHAVLLRRRLASEGARIAAELTDGEPCPVCGATEHPHPAQPSDEHVSDAEVDAADVVASAAIRDYDAAAAARAEAHTALEVARHEAGDGTPEDAAGALARAEASAAEAQEASLSLAQIDDELRALASRETTLKGALAEQSKAVDAASTEATKAEQRLADALRTVADKRGDGESVADVAASLDLAVALLDSLATAHEDLAEARAAAAEAEATLASALAEAGFESAATARDAALPTDELEALAKAVADHERDLAAARAVLGSLASGADDAPEEAPAGLAPLRLAATEAKAAHEQAIRLATQAADRVESARALADEHASRAAASATARERRNLVESLANTLEGKEPNDRRMRLESFVLAAKLEQIVAAANARLTTMSSGQYTLEYDDGAQFRGAQSGLDLRIADAHTGRSRSTRSLSGGETFLASLALALGLAETVTAEAGGIRLDTLFIDEGFGSLDGDTLEIAMSTLDDLRSGGRTIGLISHVEAMKEAIPAKLEVSKRADGSSTVAVSR